MLFRSALAIFSTQLVLAGANYSYDSTGHLLKADYGSAGAAVYAYDPAGNLISRQVQPGQTAPAPFFQGEVSLGGGVEYLQFPNGTVFGYYNFPSSSILFHYDMGFEAFVPGSSGTDIYLYDFTSGHWWYTNAATFPYLYDFSLNSWIYYFPNTTSAGHYTTNPRYFDNLTTGKIFTM
jgi:hypothetical protein